MLERDENILSSFFVLARFFIAFLIADFFRACAIGLGDENVNKKKKGD